MSPEQEKLRQESDKKAVQSAPSGMNSCQMAHWVLANRIKSGVETPVSKYRA